VDKTGDLIFKSPISVLKTWLMEPIRISAVSYLNTFPFVYGLKESGSAFNFALTLAVPSQCALHLQRGDAEVALVPAGALPGLPDYSQAADLCIGATGEVKTVLLLSKVPMEKIRKVHLDMDSRTSVELVRILARHCWKIAPAWEPLTGTIGDGSSFESLVAIGDKTFQLRPQFPYIYDLAGEWNRFSGLPMVFAVWISRRPLPEEVRSRLNEALAWGVSHRKECIRYFHDRLPCSPEECLRYLETNISYELDEKKRKGLDLFLHYLSTNP